MPATVRRLRTQHDADQQQALRRLRQVVDELAGALPPNVTQRVGTLVDRQIASERRWYFTMVNAALYAAYVTYLTEHSRRPLKAVRLLAQLIASLPDDSNEVQATRQELAERVGCTPENISAIMTEMERAGIVERRRTGRGITYIVDPNLGTHLTGATRDQAQAHAERRRGELALVD
jgi:CRP-like cAMP-binding protein